MLLESRAMADGQGEPGVRWRLPFALTLIPSYRCSATCKDCCFQSNPYIQHRVPQERLLGYIDEAVMLQTIRLVCITGGEAFLLGKDLVELISRAASNGFMTRIVTNGFWATSDARAEERLKPLIAAGLREINFSTGDDHQEFVPVSHVITGMAAAMRLGLDCAMMIEEREVRKVTRATVLADACAYPYLREALETGKILIVESPWMKFNEKTEHIDAVKRKLANRKNLSTREPCTSVMTTIVINPAEELGMCCGLPRESLPDLTAGNLRDRSLLELVDEGLHDFLKIWLFIEGPERILAWASAYDPEILWEDLYAHNCDACRAMYTSSKVQKVIEERYTEKYDEILELYALYLAGSKTACADTTGRLIGRRTDSISRPASRVPDQMNRPIVAQKRKMPLVSINIPG